MTAAMAGGADAALAGAAVLALTIAGAIAVRWVNGRLRSLRTQLLVIAGSGVVLGALTAWLLAALMLLDQAQLRPTLAVLGLTAVTGSLVVGISSTPMLRAARRLEATIRTIESGDRSVRAAVDRRDELGHVGAALDALTDRLGELDVQRRQLDEERSHMLSSISHDLRSPLAALRVALDALIDGVAPDPERYLRSMRADLDAISSLVDDVFLLARIESGTLQLRREGVDLCDCCDEAIEALTPIAHERGVELQLHTAEHVIVDANAAAIGRVVRNLIDNAIRHAPAGSAVRVTVVDTDRPHVTIHDDGDGFSEEFAAQAFERWTRADPSRNRATGGTGLGLAIARGLIDAHGGRIWIDPPPGGRVGFELPPFTTPKPATTPVP